MQLRRTCCGWLPFRPKGRGFNQQGIFDEKDLKKLERKMRNFKKLFPVY